MLLKLSTASTISCKNLLFFYIVNNQDVDRCAKKDRKQIKVPTFRGRIGFRSEFGSDVGSVLDLVLYRI